MCKSLGGSPICPCGRGVDEGGGVVEVLFSRPIPQYVHGVGKREGMGVPSSMCENSISNSMRASSSAQWWKLAWRWWYFCSVDVNAPMVGNREEVENQFGLCVRCVVKTLVYMLGWC